MHRTYFKVITKRHNDVNEIKMSPSLSTNSTGQLELKAKQNFL